jgi:general secretion pathway protein I
MKRGERGFTLLEVLVATVIMAIAVVALLSTMTTSMRNAARLTDYDRAALLARAKMDELLTATRLPRRTPLEGTWPATQAAGLRTGWRALVTPVELPPNPAPGVWLLERIELQVWWMNGENRKTFQLEGYRRGVLTQEDIAAGALTP